MVLQQLMDEITSFVAEIDAVKHKDNLNCIAINYRDKWGKILSNLTRNKSK